MPPRASTTRVVTLALMWAALASCQTARDRGATDDVTYDEEIGPLLEARCGACHGEEVAEAGYRVGSYLEVLGCVPDGEAALDVDAPGGPPLLAVLERESHAGLLSAAERTLLERWIASGSPARVGFVHPPGISDPRSPQWHGRLASELRYRRMLDRTRDDGCGRCHAGVPVEAPDDFRPVEGATDCRDCHTEPAGVLACGTCHGAGDDPLPPRDPCFFPDGPLPGAHDAHLQAGHDCATCHPEPGEEVLSGPHADGLVHVTLPEEPGWATPSFDRAASACVGACHSVTAVSWTQTGPLGCDGCHGAPPPDHPPGPCTDCHRDVESDGTGLLAGAPHLNGRVDLGDGSGRCGTCHGDGDQDPWPTSGVHLAHRAPSSSAPVPCEACHDVPSVVNAPGHIDDTTPGAEVAFSGIAVTEGDAPSYADGACSDTACHAREGAQEPTPRWEAPETPLDCESCHGAPPPPPHTEWMDCQARLCHGGEVAREMNELRITPSGRALHVNGVVNAGSR
ncbi:MAG: hypothetical protein CMH57_03175 [Myxococcales bacterium]|nr:hypothetical protein [Myxococcales bacterium]